MNLLKPKFWESNKNLFTLFLFPISLLYKIFLFFMKFFIKKIKFNANIICVGNIYVGGTGKTPLAMLIFNLLKQKQQNPAVVKKFYSNHLDEINMISDKIGGLFVDRSRKKAIKNAITKGFNTLILDDGYQDLAIHKNLNIICFNSEQLIGNGHVLPAGPLREPLSSLKKCKIVVINGEKKDFFNLKLKKKFPNLKIFYSNYIPINIKEFQNKNIFAFAGVGNPENFFNLLKKNGFFLKKTKIFPDHYPYSKKELLALIDSAKRNNLEIITTEKDYYRILKFNLNEIKFIKINLIIENEKVFIEEILKYLS